MSNRGIWDKARYDVKRACMQLNIDIEDGDLAHIAKSAEVLANRGIRGSGNLISAAISSVAANLHVQLTREQIDGIARKASEIAAAEGRGY